MMDSSSFRTVIIDDMPIDSLGTQAFLENTEFQFEACFRSISQAVAYFESNHVDLVISEISLPDALQLPSRIEASAANCLLVFFSGNQNPVLLNEARKANCGGVIDKAASREEFLGSLRSVIRDGDCWTRSTSRRIVGALSAQRVDFGNETALTKREFRILELISQGFTNQKIAEEIGVSFETVKEHVQNILRKLHVTDRTQAAVWMIRESTIDKVDSVES